MIRIFLSIIVLSMLHSSPSLAWIPPAQLVVDCAEGKNPVWPTDPTQGKGMGHGSGANTEDCKKMLIDDIRSKASSLNDSAHQFCILTMTDDKLYRKLLGFYRDKYKNSSNLTFMTLVDEFLWEVFACSKEVRLKHISDNDNVRRQKIFYDTAEADFVRLTSYENKNSGKTYCALGTEFNAFINRHHITTLEQWTSLDLTSALKADYPCPKK